jgi:hypothetical protein
MIDPDGIITQPTNLGNVIHINSTEIPVCEGEIFCLDDEKDYERYVREIEGQVRKSFEYRQMIAYLRDNMNMNQCAFLKGVSNEETYSIKIEIHHYPFSLRDIVDIVVRKRTYYNESLNVQMVAKEVMLLHYKLMIGLIPLSETVHELAHNSRLFVPVDKVMGRYELFVQYYKPFCTTEQLEVLERIEKYSAEEVNSVLNTNIIEQNKVVYDIKDSNYVLPDVSSLNTRMLEQMKRIKDNNYMLPSVDEVKMLEKPKVKPAITFNPALIKNKPEGN